MKKKRFYNNKKRGQKWTEEVRGRKINFADKYIAPYESSDKFDNKRPTAKKQIFTRDNLLKLIKRVIITVLCLCIVGVGYTIMDVNIIRHRMPDTPTIDDSFAGINSVDVKIGAVQIVPLSMDGGVMLSSVIDELLQSKYTCALFDLKRADGTISYHSKLATIETYGAISSPASDIEKSIKLLTDNDVLPVARICCYRDSIAPFADSSVALKTDGKIYKDEGSNAYLDPDSTSAYNYIRDIIEEGASMGVSVFVLDYCQLPEAVRENHKDGFKALAERLYRDIDSEIKLIEAQHISIKGKSAKSITKELDEKLEGNQASTVYYISTKKEETVKELLDKKGNINYIIAQ